MSRNAAAGAAIVEELAARGVQVLPLAGDVADEASLRAALAQIAAQAPRLRGVVHAAADLSVAPIGELDESRVRSMLRPKLCGVALLERLTQSLELDFLVLFSSTTALLGASGYAHYAAANAFLDATAHAFNRPGHRVLSVNWGTWEAMRGVSDADRRRYRESGLEPMTAEEALRALGALLAQPDCAQATVAHIDWSVLKPLHELRRVRPLLAELGDAPPRRTNTQLKPAEVRGGGTSLSERLAAAPESLRNEVLIEFVRAEVGAVLGVQDPERLTLDTGLFEMGMDSLMAVELRKRLERGAGRKLPSTLTFNYPSIGALAGFIARAGEPQDRAMPSEPHAITPAPAPAPAADDLDTLTDEQLEERLLARLETVR
jgi:NAD(P)-dependent dehydrogenase (short-subunit alcohol dehydrogenase family)/acyl carrier protein